jgi:hypothetical protein
MSLLREHGVYPSKEVLENALGEVYAVFEELETCLVRDESAFTLDWIYSDGVKTWSCKVCHNTNSVFWISVYVGFFKTFFIFSAEQSKNIAFLEISEQIKTDFFRAKPIGVHLPLRINITRREQLSDLLKIVEFKKKFNGAF